MNSLISIGIIGLTLFVSVGEIKGVQLRDWLYIPFFLLIVGTSIKYKDQLIRKFKKNPLLIPMIGGIILCTLSLIRSVDIIESIRILIALILGIIGYHFIVINLEEKRNVEVLLIALLIGFFYVVGVGIYQYFFFLQVMRIYSTWGEPNVFGDYLVFVLPVFCSLLFSKRKKYWKIIYGIAFALGIVTLLLTYTRASWVAIFGALVFLLIYKKKKLILLSFIGISILVAFVPSPISQRIKTIFQLSHSTNRERILIWKASIKMIKKSPIIGIGLGTLSKVYPEYKLPHAQREEIHSCHNLYFRFLVEIGILGLMIFIYAMVILFRMGFKFLSTKRDEFWHPLIEGVLAVLVGILILGLFEG
jgi:O-antigen ligase